MSGYRSSGHAPASAVRSLRTPCEPRTPCNRDALEVFAFRCRRPRNHPSRQHEVGTSGHCLADQRVLSGTRGADDGDEASSHVMSGGERREGGHIHLARADALSRFDIVEDAQDCSTTIAGFLDHLQHRFPIGGIQRRRRFVQQAAPDRHMQSRARCSPAVARRPRRSAVTTTTAPRGCATGRGNRVRGTLRFPRRRPRQAAARPRRLRSRRAARRAGNWLT